MNLSSVNSFQEHPRSLYFSPAYTTFNEKYGALKTVALSVRNETISLKSALLRADKLKKQIDKILYDPETKRNIAEIQYNSVKTLFDLLLQELQLVNSLAQLEQSCETLQKGAHEALMAFKQLLCLLNDLQQNNDKLTIQEFVALRMKNYDRIEALSEQIREEYSSAAGQSTEEKDICGMHEQFEDYAAYSNQLIFTLQAQNEMLKCKFSTIQETMELRYSGKINLLEREIQRLKMLMSSLVSE